MHKKISIGLSEKDINYAINSLKQYSVWLETKTKMLIERLALIGAKEASVRFTTAMYDGKNDVKVTVEQIENGWVIKAEGESVCFIEFGAGVYHNASEPYPMERPKGVVKIGEYGQGKGNQQAWGFYNPNGELVITRGNPAAMPMYYATVEIEREIQNIAREVFAN